MKFKDAAKFAFRCLLILDEAGKESGDFLEGCLKLTASSANAKYHLVITCTALGARANLFVFWDEMDSDINLEQLSSRLQIVEDSTRQRGQVAVAATYASGIMREIVNPLESLNNLVYLMAHSPEEPTMIALFVEMAQEELLRLNEIAKRTIHFCDENHSAVEST